MTDAFFPSLQYYEMSYGLNVEMHKQVILKSIIIQKPFQIFYVSKTLWLSSFLDAGIEQGSHKSFMASWYVLIRLCHRVVSFFLMSTTTFPFFADGNSQKAQRNYCPITTLPISRGKLKSSIVVGYFVVLFFHLRRRRRRRRTQNFRFALNFTAPTTSGNSGGTGKTSYHVRA